MNARSDKYGIYKSDFVGYNIIGTRTGCGNRRN